MSVVPSQAPVSAPEPFFSRTETRLDILKFVVPFLLMFIGFLFTLYITQQAQGRTIEENSAKIATFQDAKEARGERLIVVETKLQAVQTDVTEMKADIKKLLERIPAK